MKPTEWLVSVFVVVVIALKIAEGAFELERWPITRVAMFSRRVPPTHVMWRVTLEGTTGGRWVELRAGQFHLGPDEYRRRLPSDPALLRMSCIALGRLYNQGRPPAARLRQLRARLTNVPRPGVPGQDQPSEQVIDCPLDPPGRTG